MRNYFYLWQRIHIVTNLATNSLANMLHIIKSFDDTIILNAEEKRAAQAIGKSTYTLQPTLRFLFLKHHLEVVCCTFSYQGI